MRELLQVILLLLVWRAPPQRYITKTTGRSTVTNVASFVACAGKVLLRVVHAAKRISDFSELEDPLSEEFCGCMDKPIHHG